MIRSMLILFLLQSTRNCYGLENNSDLTPEAGNRIVQMSFEESSSSESSIEELTTLNYLIDTKIENNPPTSTQTIQTLIPDDSTLTSSSQHPQMMRLLATSESSSVEMLTEATNIMKANRFHDNDNEDDSDDQLEVETNVGYNRPTQREPKVIEDNLETPSTKREEALDNSMGDTTTTPELDSDNETYVDTADDLTTIQPSITKTKEPKQIKIYKTSPNELLKMYVEDCHLRSPVAALVDKKSNPLLKAKKLWKAALKPNSLLDIMVVSYDSEGIKSTYNLTNTKTMMETLDKVREENVTDRESKTYYSIIRTGQLIPYDSAIFLSTDTLPNDTEHQQPASMILLKKRIRLYLVIFDEKNNNVSEKASTAVRQTGFLGKLALRTGGDIIYVPNHAFKSDGELGKITLVVADKIKTLELAPLEEVDENELKSSSNNNNNNTDDVMDEIELLSADTTSIR